MTEPHFETWYLQHGTGDGPFRTEAVKVRNITQLEAYFETLWRKIRTDGNRHYIYYRDERITIQEGK